MMLHANVIRNCGTSKGGVIYKIKYIKKNVQYFHVRESECLRHLLPYKGIYIFNVLHFLTQTTQSSEDLQVMADLRRLVLPLFLL